MALGSILTHLPYLWQKSGLAEFLNPLAPIWALDWLKGQKASWKTELLLPWVDLDEPTVDYINFWFPPTAA